MKRNLLLTPGPIAIPPQIYAAMAKPIPHHRTPQFQQYLKEVHEGLQYVFQTKNPIYIFPASGTGTMEAAVANLLSPGDKAITVEGGKFGERWTELCNAYGAKPNVIKVQWGHAVKAGAIKEQLKANPDTKAVFVTLNETSTAVVTDVKAIGEVVKGTNAVLVVDAISGMGAVDCQTDNWHLDVVCSATHKGFMLPPGLAFLSVSPKAEALINSSTNARYYFDLRQYKKAWKDTDTPYTTAITLVIAMLESLKYFKETGLPKMFTDFAKLAAGTRAAAKGLGLKIFAQDYCASNALTPIMLPDGIDGEKLVKIMRDNYGVTVAGGQGELKGKIIRISHMGCIDEYDILTGISCLEKVLKQMGYKFELGAGLAAAQKVFNS